MHDAAITAAEEIISLVETWFFESFQGSAVARSTETWNVVHAAKDDLKRRLADLLTDRSKD